MDFLVKKPYTKDKIVLTYKVPNLTDIFLCLEFGDLVVRRSGPLSVSYFPRSNTNNCPIFTNQAVKSFQCYEAD